MGRSRRYDTPAARQRAYRERLAQQPRERDPHGPPVGPRETPTPAAPLPSSLPAPVPPTRTHRLKEIVADLHDLATRVTVLRRSGEALSLPPAPFDRDLAEAARLLRELAAWTERRQ